MTLGILDLLSLSGFDRTANARMARHQQGRYPVRELLRNDWFDCYQAYQRRSVFHGVDLIISFYGLTGTRACFYGVFHVDGFKPSSEGPIPSGCEWAKDWHSGSKYYYLLKRDRQFDHLAHRAIIEWGKGARAWVQKVSNKPIRELTETGRVLPPFEDYLEFTLSYDQLREMFSAEDAHREWRASLHAVAGVYLILAEESGDMYVGSASGEEGIWGRWRQYAKTGHGGNHLLRSLIKQDSRYPKGFRFSLLQILPKTMTRDEVIHRESLYKEKLGTRAVGLNLN